MRTATSTIAIVGGGSVGTSVIHQLASRILAVEPHGIREVLVFEPKAKIGAGAAYQLDTDSNILNTRAVGMSADAKDASHFFNWVVRNEARWRNAYPHVQLSECAFLPRALFGAYLEDTFIDAKAVLQACGIQVKHIRAEICGLAKSGDVYLIETIYGRRYEASQVVLTVGNHEGNRFQDLKNSKGFFSSPYPCNVLTQSIHPDASVCILGSSLSAIDAAVSLADAGHRGPISMASRNGRLPSVRGEISTSLQLSILKRDRISSFIEKRGGALRLADIADLLREEISLAQGREMNLNEIMTPHFGVSRYLDHEVALADTEDRVWQSVIYGLNEAIDLVWHALPEEDRREFDAKYRSTWLAYRVSFPVENARKVQKLLHTDQLKVYGGVSRVTQDAENGKFAIHLTPTGYGMQAVIYSDVVVDATGYVLDISQWQSPLLRNLVDKGLAKQHEFGGIHADFTSSQVLRADGEINAGLYALGSVVTGTFFWTNAMNVNCRLASDVVSKLVELAHEKLQMAKPLVEGFSVNPTGTGKALVRDSKCRPGHPGHAAYLPGPQTFKPRATA